MGKRSIPSMKPKAPTATPATQTPAPEAPKPQNYEGFSPFEKEALSHYDTTGKFPTNLHQQPKQNPSPAFLAAVKPHAEKLRSAFSASKAKELGTQTPFALVNAQARNEIGDSRKKYHEEAAKIANQITDRKERRKALSDLWHKHMEGHQDTLNNLSESYRHAGEVSRGNQALTHAAIAEPTESQGAGQAMAGGGVASGLSEKKLRTLGSSPIAKEKSKQKLEGLRSGGKDVLESARTSKEALESKMSGLPNPEDVKLDPEAQKLVGLYYAHYGDLHGGSEKWRSGKQHIASGAGGLPGLEAMGHALAQYNPPKEGEEGEGHFERYLSSALRHKLRQGASREVSPLVRKLESSTRKEEQKRKSGEVKHIDPATGKEKTEMPSSIEDAHAEIMRLREQLGQAAPKSEAPKTILRKPKPEMQEEEKAPEWDINEGPPGETEDQDVEDQEPATPEEAGDEENIEDVASAGEAPTPEEAKDEETEKELPPEGTVSEDSERPTHATEDEGAGEDFGIFLPESVDPGEREDFLHNLADKLVAHKAKTGKYPQEVQDMIDNAELPPAFQKYLLAAKDRAKGKKPVKGKWE